MARKQSTIRFQLACLVLACVVPVWLIATFLVLHTYTSKLDRANDELLETARTMTMVVDQELASVQAALLALSTSPSFRTRDFRDIHRQTLEILKTYPGADIIAADGTGQQLVNSFRPYGTPLPKRNNPQIVRTIFETGRPVISNLFFGSVTKRPLIAVDVPVFLDGKVAYDLSMTFPSARLASLLPRQKGPAGWFCTIVDRDHTIVARTREHQRYVGKKTNDVFRQAVANRKEGALAVRNIAGEESLGSFCRSAISGWIITFGVPKATVMAEIYQWVLWAILGATVISLIGIGFAMGIAGRIARDIQSLVAPALAIGRGELVGAVGDSSVKETAEVASALVQASELLQIRSGERDAAEHRLSIAIEELRKETGERLQALEELRKKEQMLVQQSRQAALGEMIGNIAHQWRQPLNSLALLVQQPPIYYECGKADGEFLEENCDKAMEVIKHMSRTIDDFRNFFKADKEKVSFRVCEEVAMTLSLLEGSLQGPRIAVSVEAQEDVQILGYPNEFSQVLLNILINARDAFVERQVADPKVAIRIAEQGGKAVVTITDNAGGISEEIIDKIFDPYFTTKGPQAGTGVGLFMSKTIIEKNMGGLLTARNVVNGAEFRIEV